MGWRRGKFSVVAGVTQVAFLVVFSLFAKYDKQADAKHPSNSRSLKNGGANPDKNTINQLYYAMFQDSHIMIFIGFGYIVTFLKRYAYSGLAMNFFIGSLVIQWSSIMMGLLNLQNGEFTVDVKLMIFAEFGAGAVLLSFGIVLGKASPVQYIVMAVMELPIYHVNEWICRTKFGAVDVGGSTSFHIFSTYFGLAVSVMIRDDAIYRSPNAEKKSSTYISDIFSLIGTLYLWTYWPSFNSAAALPGDDQHRAIINTYYSLTASTVTALTLSSVLAKDGKFEMIHVQASVLGGGCAVGTVSDFMLQPWGALLIGMSAATVCVLGYNYVTPFMSKTLKIDDTCGVHNVHGLAGYIGACGGIIGAYVASEGNYGLSLYEKFPERAPIANSTELLEIQAQFNVVTAGSGRTAAGQAMWQAAALGFTIAMSIVGGIITGVIMRLPIWNQPTNDDFYEDGPYWKLPNEGHPHVFVDGVKLPNKGDNPAITDPHTVTNSVQDITIKSADTKI